MSRRGLLIIIAAVIAAAICIPIYRTMANASIRANMIKVETANPPMSLAVVEKLLGSPARIDHAETTGITGDVYHYPIHDADFKVVFVNGVVFNAQYVDGAKS